MKGDISREMHAFMHVADAIGLEKAIELRRRRPGLLRGMAKQPYGKQIPWLFVEIWKGRMKDTKSEARYDTPPNSTERCGLCAHYRIGVCTMVEGRISSTMWCKHFKRREDV